MPKKTVILVIAEGGILSYADQYRIFEDTDEGRVKALEWAQKQGYENFFGMTPTFELGMLSFHQIGKRRTGFIRIEVQE